MYATLDSWVASRFLSVEDLFSMRKDMDCVVLLTDLKYYALVGHKFNQVYWKIQHKFTDFWCGRTIIWKTASVLQQRALRHVPVRTVLSLRRCTTSLHPSYACLTGQGVSWSWKERGRLFHWPPDMPPGCHLVRGCKMYYLS